MKVEKLTAEEIQKFETKEPALLFAKGFLLNMYKNMNEGERIEDYIGELKEAVDYYEVIVKYGYNETFRFARILLVMIVTIFMKKDMAITM
jgi:hypothetical protein